MNEARECPGCESVDCRRLETVDVNLQHEKYVRGNLAVAKELTEILDLGTDSFSMVLCNDCGLEYACPLTAPDGRWYSLLYSHAPLYPQNRWEFRYTADKLKRDDRVLDYGCGNGEFLETIRDHEKYSLGVDFSDAAVADVNRRGLKAINVLDIGSLTNKFSVVVAFHCLEHLTDPASFFQTAETVSKDEATMWVAIPSDRRPSRVFGEADYLDQPPHHMTRWSTSSLERVAGKSRWKFVEVIYEPSSLRTKVWELSRRSPGYRLFAKRGHFFERMYRAVLFLPILVFGRNKCSQLSGFSMLAKYTLNAAQ